MVWGGSSSPAQTHSVQRESIPAPTEGAAILKGGRRGGGGRELSHDHNSCFGGRCVFILLTHLLITKVLTLEPRCIRCSRRFAYFHWGSGYHVGRRRAAPYPPGEKECSPAQQQQSTHVLSPGRLWLNSIRKIPKVKFQLTCGPGRLSNTSFGHLNSLSARRSAQ